MNKYAIYMVAIDDPNTKVKNSDYAQYAIASWQKWCDKNGVEFVVFENRWLPLSYKPIWHKEAIFNGLEVLEYDKIGVVDADTIIHPNAPNIFETLEDGVSGVNDICDLNWLFESIADRQRFFPEIGMDVSKYINAGVIFLSKDVYWVMGYLLQFYTENKHKIDAILGGGKEQTLLNFMLQQEEVKINLLSPAWNLLSIHRKNMFTHNWQLNIDQTPYFIKYAYIWHFTGFPIEDRVRLMQQTWELVKDM